MHRQPRARGRVSDRPRSSSWPGVRLWTAALPILLIATLAPMPGSAATSGACPSDAVGGKSIGAVTVGDLVVPIKRTKVRAGVLDAPPSAKIAALARDYLPLESRYGTSVIVWHSRFGPGCMGTLNVLFAKRPGDTFALTDASGEERHYRIVVRKVVPKGKYQASWFRLEGRRQITLVSCTHFDGARFLSNLVLLAVAAPTPTPAATPTPSDTGTPTPSPTPTPTPTETATPPETASVT